MLCARCVVSCYVVVLQLSTESSSLPHSVANVSSHSHSFAAASSSSRRRLLRLSRSHLQVFCVFSFQFQFLLFLFSCCLRDFVYFARTFLAQLLWVGCHLNIKAKCEDDSFPSSPPFLLLCSRTCSLLGRCARSLVSGLKRRLRPVAVGFAVAARCCCLVTFTTAALTVSCIKHKRH